MKDLSCRFLMRSSTSSSLIIPWMNYQNYQIILQKFSHTISYKLILFMNGLGAQCRRDWRLEALYFPFTFFSVRGILFRAHGGLKILRVAFVQSSSYYHLRFRVVRIGGLNARSKSKSKSRFKAQASCELVFVSCVP